MAGTCQAARESARERRKRHAEYVQAVGKTRKDMGFDAISRDGRWDVNRDRLKAFEEGLISTVGCRSRVDGSRLQRLAAQQITTSRRRASEFFSVEERKVAALSR